MFIDPAAPRSDYHLTYNCVGATDNQRTFNDGYHVVHHVNSKVHWADLPAQFEASLERHAANDGALSFAVPCTLSRHGAPHTALVFEGMHFFDVGWAVMCGNYGRLRRALVPLSRRVAAMDEQQVELWLRSKLQPVGPPKNN